MSHTDRNEKRKLRLGAFIPAAGHHVAAWRHPDAQADGGHSLKHYIRVAQAAEQAKFDMVFLADSAAVWGGGDQQQALNLSARGAHFEPITLLSALAAVTKRIGLTATVTTTYNEPYHLARKFASLDHLSEGRAGWNLVTSANQAEAQISVSTNMWRMRSATSARKSSSTWSRAYGIAGKTMLACCSTHLFIVIYFSYGRSHTGRNVLGAG